MRGGEKNIGGAGWRKKHSYLLAHVPRSHYPCHNLPRRTGLLDDPASRGTGVAKDKTLPQETGKGMFINMYIYGYIFHIHTHIRR